MNNSKPPFDDVNFRLAVSRALDRQKIASQFFDKAFRKMVGAFETRAAELYGSKSSSATSVA